MGNLAKVLLKRLDWAFSESLCLYKCNLFYLSSFIFAKSYLNMGPSITYSLSGLFEYPKWLI